MKERLAGIRFQLETLLFLPLAAFTPKQRKAIVDRDGGKCQAKGIIPHQCIDELQVHHLKPQRYLKELGVDPDYCENGLTVCRNAHEQIHPDAYQARLNYHNDPKSYSKMFDERNELLKSRTIYWKDTWDRPLSTLAIKNTQDARRKGWVFPDKKEHDNFRK